MSLHSLADEQEAAIRESIEDARNKGLMNKADSLASELLILANQSGSTKWQAEALYEQARNSMERNNYDNSSSLLNESIALFQSAGERKRLGDAYRQLGLTFRYQANYSTALEYIYLAMQIYQEIEDKSAISSAYNSIGVVMEKMGQLEQASEAHNQALQIYYELNNESGVASALYNLGDIYRSMGDFDRALTYLLDALKMDIAAGDPKNIAYSHNKIGYMLNQMGRSTEARGHLEKALELFQQIETPRDTDWALSSIAQLELDVGNIDLAKQIIDGVIQRAVENGYNSLLVGAYQVAIKIAILQGEYDDALELIDKGVEQALANDEAKDRVYFEELRVEALVGKNALLDALNAMKKQKELDDAILDGKRIDTIARLQAEADFFQQAQRIKLLENEKALQKANSEREQLTTQMWLVVVIALSIVTFLVYSRFNQHKLNKILSSEVRARTKQLEEKNQELSDAYDHMETISMTDKLTGINNRRYLETSIEHDLSQTARKYEDWYTGQNDKPVGEDIVFFLIDLDDFKSINDSYGHSVGDKVLQQLVKRMANVFRQSDYLVRWGGEEFVAVARFIDRKDAPGLAQRMIDEVRKKPFELSANSVTTLTCSIGYSCFYGAHEQQNINWRTLLSVADACAYVVKYSGKNAWFGVENANVDLFQDAEFEPKNLQILYKKQSIAVKTSLAKDAIKWQ